MTPSLKPTTATTILTVDDHPDNLRLLAKLLEAQGYSVRKSLNGQMALQSIEYDLPDLILLDITMPEMNGYQVCQQLKASEATSNIPIIFISALDCVEDKVKAFEAGGQDYITKPFQELEVLMRVKNQLLIQQQQRQLIEQNQRLEEEVQKRLRIEAEIRALSLTDELTGLYNRRGFFLLAEQQLRLAKRLQRHCYLLFADIDGLKQINDLLGHAVGDRLIIDAANVLKETFRYDDVVARLGGDEFAVLIPDCLDNLEEFNYRIQARIEDFNRTFNGFYRLSMSIGIGRYPIDSEVSLDCLLAQADHLMYKQKRLKYSRAEVHSISG